MEKSLFNSLRIHPAATLRRAGRSMAASLGAAMLLCALAAVSCSKEIIDEQPGGPASGETRTVPVTLKTGLDAQIDVKSVSGIDENAIKNVWVVQLSEDGSQQLAAPQYVSELQKIGVVCRFDAELALQPSQVICLANTGNPGLLPATGNTLASLSALSYAVTDEASLVSDGAIPSVALWTGTPAVTGIPVLELKRATAKLNLSVNARLTEGFTFQLKSIKVCNVPKKAYYFENPDGTTPFPGISDGKNEVFVTTQPDQTLQAETPVEFGCLLPCNHRGKGTGTKPTDKTSANAPQGQADYCTYVELAGEYLSPNGNEYHADCKFRIYLGENLTDDYNILAGHQYNLSVTITGASDADARLVVNESYGDQEITTGARWVALPSASRTDKESTMLNVLYNAIYLNRQANTIQNLKFVPTDDAVLRCESVVIRDNAVICTGLTLTYTLGWLRESEFTYENVQETHNEIRLKMKEKTIPITDVSYVTWGTYRDKTIRDELAKHYAPYLTDHKNVIPSTDRRLIVRADLQRGLEKSWINGTVYINADGTDGTQQSSGYYQYKSIGLNFPQSGTDVVPIIRK